MNDAYKCGVCGYVYDPQKGDPSQDIAPGTPFDLLGSRQWTCPECGVDTNAFTKE